MLFGLTKRKDERELERRPRDIFDTELFRDFSVFFPDFKEIEHGMQASVRTRDEKDKYIVEADLPGTDEKDIAVSLEENTLHIKAERKEEVKEEKDGKTVSTTKTYGRFERAFTIPQNVDADKISADYKNGMLKVNLPKKEIEAKPQKKITLNTK